ncbi:RNA polymerase sigma factor [Poriferisphaera sp. WC338]|uniref:RNA polymerase sigma factor n=1 Tax=Poriferisphaera sp. WC338 TaxID=3425129 RepID=UPI003D8153B8
MTASLSTDIINKLKEQDAHALSQMYRAYVTDIWQFAYYRTFRNHDAADELTSTIFLAVVTSIHRFDPKQASFETWLYTIARNKIADHLRKHYRNKNRNIVPIHTTPHPAFEPQHQQTLEETELITVTLENLTPQEQQILLWKYKHKLTIKQIAEKLNRTNKAAENLIYRARARFKHHYNRLDKTSPYITTENRHD